MRHPLAGARPLVARTGRSTASVYDQVKKLVGIGVLREPSGSYDRLYVAEAIWDAIRL